MDKFNYLTSLLQSSAAEEISGLKITAENYNEALEVLKQRFGNKQQIANSQMDGILQLPALTSLHDVQGLRRLYEKTESHVGGLKSWGIEVESYGNLIIWILMQRLPPGLRIAATKKMEEDGWSMEKLLTFIQKEVEARERATLQGSPATKTGLLSANCKTVTNVIARRDILERSGRCFVCLKKNHISKECQSNKKCFKCGRRHHASLCNDQRRPNFNQPQFQSQQQDGDPRQPPVQTIATRSGERSFQPTQRHEENGSAPSKEDTSQQEQASTSQTM